MNKYLKNKSFHYINFIPYIFLLLIVFLSVGYSAFENDVAINDITSEVRLYEDIRITSANVENTSTGTSDYVDYNVNKITSSIDLPNQDSTITFLVEVTNFGNTEMGIFDITGLPSNLDYEIQGYTLKAKICNSSNSCTLGIKKQFYITIKYFTNTSGVSSYNSSNTKFNIQLDFDFRKIHQIKYTDMANNGYQTELINGDDLTVKFTTNIPTNLIVKMNNSQISNYSYSNGTLTINNVTGDIEIIEKLNAPTVTVSLLDDLVTSSYLRVHMEGASSMTGTSKWKNLAKDSEHGTFWDFNDGQTTDVQISKSGNYAQLNAGSDGLGEYIWFSGNNMNPNNSTFTYEATVLFNSFTDYAYKSYNTIFSNSDYHTGITALVQPDGIARAFLGNGNGYHIINSSESYIKLNTIYTFTITFDSSKNMSFYINGTLIGKIANATYNPSVVTKMMLGGEPLDDSNYAQDATFRGNIYTFRVYDGVALSQTQIRNNYGYDVLKVAKATSTKVFATLNLQYTGTNSTYLDKIQYKIGDSGSWQTYSSAVSTTLAIGTKIYAKSISKNGYESAITTYTVSA